MIINQFVIDFFRVHPYALVHRTSSKLETLFLHYCSRFSSISERMIQSQLTKDKDGTTNSMRFSSYQLAKLADCEVSTPRRMQMQYRPNPCITSDHLITRPRFKFCGRAIDTFRLYLPVLECFLKINFTGTAAPLAETKVSVGRPTPSPDYLLVLLKFSVCIESFTSFCSQF